MSGNPYTPYYPVPTGGHEESTPLTYPPTPIPPNPAPTHSYVPPKTSSAYSHLPSSSASGSFPYSTDSPQPFKKMELDHDFTPDPKRPVLDDYQRWSFSSVNRPPELRRFTRPWWRYYWRLQISRRRMPRLLYGVTGIILIAAWIGIAIRFAMTLQSAEAENGAGNINLPNATLLSGQFNADRVMFFMSGSLNRFDPATKTLNIDWSALMIQGPIIGDLSNAVQVPVEEFGNYPLAIYRDTVARPDEELRENITSYVPYRLKAPGIKPIGFLGISDFDSINTDISLQQESSSILTAAEFAYPFDVFVGNLTFVAANNATILETGRLGSDIRRINGAVLQDSILGFKVKASSVPTCLDPIAPGCELLIQITLTRTGLVKFCAICTFIIGWVITISIFFVTGEALLVNRSNILEGTDILAICFTALFALPTVRSLLPNVPSTYGCLLDILGILPNVIIVTLCTTFFTNSRLRMRARQAAEAAAEARQAAKAA